MFDSRPNDRNKESTGIDGSKKQVAARFACLKKVFADPLTETYIQFFYFCPLTLHIMYFGSFIQIVSLIVSLIMTKGLFQEIGKRFLKLDAVRDLTMEIFENEEIYLTLSELHIALKIDLQEEINGETIIKSQHDTFLKVCQAFCKSSVVHMMMKM